MRPEDIGSHLFAVGQEGNLVLSRPREMEDAMAQHERDHEQRVGHPYLQRTLLVCAAGEAALAFVPEYPGEAGSGQDLADALEIDLDMEWEEWVLRARDFLLKPAIRRRVEVLAEALMVRRTIGGTEALKIIREAM